jgi:hypothetical protein
VETQTQTQNPLLASLRVPGRTFQLPSRGAFYTNGELSSDEGELHVYPMSALTEINLKNPDLLFNGKALETVLGECIPDIKKPLDLFGRDIDAVMFFLRLVTYGPNFEVNVKHTCTDAKSHSYTIDIEKMVMEMKQLDPTVANTQFQVTLANGQVVKLKPVTFQHMIKLFQLNADKKELSAEDIKTNIVFNLVNIIDSVDNITDKKLIEGWVRAIPSIMQNRITDVIEKMNDWGPASSAKLTCKDCGEEMDVELPLNPVSFFTE